MRTQTLGGEVGTKRGQRDSHAELDLRLRHLLQRPPQRQSGARDQHERDRRAEHRGER